MFARSPIIASFEQKNMKSLHNTIVEGSLAPFNTDFFVATRRFFACYSEGNTRKMNAVAAEKDD